MMVNKLFYNWNKPYNHKNSLEMHRKSVQNASCANKGSFVAIIAHTIDQIEQNI